jgi:hypothetical protein
MSEKDDRNPTNSLFIGYVADTIEFISGGVQDYDATADFAHNLLAEFGYLLAAADAFSQGAIGASEFDAAVRRALSEWGDDR